MLITKATHDALRTDGFAHVRQVLPADTVDRLRVEMDRLGLDTQPGAYGRLVHDTWRRSAMLEDVLRNGVLPELVASLLGERPVLFQDHLISKEPGSTEEVKWHQDFSYWPLQDAVGLTTWVALDDADVANGCLHYLPGSQRRGECQPAAFVAGVARLERPKLPPLVVDESQAVAMPATAGDVLVHDPLVVHFSPENPTRRPRRGWAISWVTERARWDPDHSPHPYGWQMTPQAGQPLDPALFPRCA